MRLDARNHELIYDLGEAGLQALKDAQKVGSKRPRRNGPWWHSHLIASVTAGIEIATLARDGLGYIHELKILEHAQASIRFPTHRGILIPDALFGLEYITADRALYRFYALEVDRATEPITSADKSRKSLKRMFEQYAQWIGKQEYKQHLNLTAPMLLLFITTTHERMERTMNVAKQHAGLPIFFTVIDTELCTRPFTFVDIAGKVFRIDK